MKLEDDRLPPLDPTLWSDEQRRHAEEIVSGPRGALLAPFVPLLRSPELMGHAQRMGEYLRYRSAIGPRLSELAILVTAREWSQKVEWTIHAPIARREGVAAETVEAIAAGHRPAKLSPEEAVVLDFSQQLHRRRRVDDGTWRAAVERFGEQGAVDLIGINGYYAFLAMVMNAARTAGPRSDEPPLADLER